MIGALCSLCPELQFTSCSEVTGRVLLPALPPTEPFGHFVSHRAAFRGRWGGGGSGSKGPASPGAPFPAPSQAANPRTSTPSSPSQTFQEPRAPNLGSAPRPPVVQTGARCLHLLCVCSQRPPPAHPDAVTARPALCSPSALLPCHLCGTFGGRGCYGDHHSHFSG